MLNWEKILLNWMPLKQERLQRGVKHPDVFRVVDRDGNWENYYVKSMNAYLPGVTTILNRGYAKGAFFEQWLSQHTAEERDQILKAAGEKGDKVHRAIDYLLSTAGVNVAMFVGIDRQNGVYNRETEDYEKLSNDEWDALLAFASFWKAHEPQVLTSEATLYNVWAGYIGIPSRSRRRSATPSPLAQETTQSTGASMLVHPTAKEMQSAERMRYSPSHSPRSRPRWTGNTFPRRKTW